MKVVSERLGHSNVAFTMNVYQHVLPGMQAAAADAFSQLLRAESSGDADSAETIEDSGADHELNVSEE